MTILLIIIGSGVGSLIAGLIIEYLKKPSLAESIALEKFNKKLKEAEDYINNSAGEK